MSQHEETLTMVSSHRDATDFAEEIPKQNIQKGLRFWAIMFALALTGLLTALEATISSTVLPDIIADLSGGGDYVWVVDGYFLTMASLQPMFGQIANLFGRRWPLIVATIVFLLGSGVCGGSTNIAMLISGRVLQGFGASGINVLVETIVCDLVPLRERGNYMAILFGLIGIGTALGPLFGGLIVAHSSWRWVFYLALPVGGLALVMMILYMHVNYNRSDTLATRLGSLDWVGNIIFVGATSSVLIALSWAGDEYPWSSFHVIVPLVIGMVALAGFILLESSHLIPNPMMPIRLFGNRTSTITFIVTFLHGLVSMWALYFLPVYFQGVLGATVLRSGIMLLPTILVLIPFAIIGGVLLTKFGRYKPIFVVGFTFLVVGFGLFTLLDQSSSTAAWVGFQIVESAGVGLTIPALLPAVLAPLTDKDTALATGTWAFMRSFGLTWGVAIGAAVFNTRAEQLASSGAIANTTIANDFIDGNAYQDATLDFLDSLSTETRSQVVALQSASLQRAWQVAIAFAGVGFLLVAFLKEVPLRNELESEYGITEKAKTENS